MTRSDLASRLLAAFFEDFEEQRQAVESDLLALEANPSDEGRLHSLFRAAHTLKGAARAASLPLVEGMWHALEERLVTLRDGEERLQADDVHLLTAAMDVVARVGERIAAGGGVDGSELEARIAAITRGELPAPAPAPDAASTPAAPRTDGRVRVAAERLDALLDAVGHASLLQRRLERELDEVLRAHEEVGFWVRRVLDSTRGEADGAPDAGRLRGRAAERLPELLQALDRAEGGVRRQLREISVSTGQLVRHSFDLRLRPFADVFQPLPRLVRDLAEEMEKEIRLVLSGEEVEADRAVIDVVREALLHAVRNAADHGIEAPEERARAGKPRAGTISVAAALEGDRVRVSVVDDGRGVDRDAVRRRLERAGRSAPDDDLALVEALFDRGFSTQESPTAISGRGVGLDAVRTALERINGSVVLRSESGRGTTLVMECPLTLATARVLVVHAGSSPFAIPTAAVELLRRVPREEVQRHGSREVVNHDGEPVAIAPLSRILGVPAAPAGAESPTLPVAILHHGGRRLAVAVDALVDEMDAVVRPVHRAGQALPMVTGATLLAEGGVAVVLNPGPLLEAGLGVESSGLGDAGREERPRPRVLIADDSITTRTLEHSVLQSAGYEVHVAVDGMDAWQKLQEIDVDLLVSDVEMPRMDGFELCRRVRASARHQELPIILVTSLENEEFRLRGMEAGADAYVTKAGFDHGDLLQRVERLIGGRDT